MPVFKFSLGDNLPQEYLQEVLSHEFCISEEHKRRGGQSPLKFRLKPPLSAVPKVSRFRDVSSHKFYFNFGDLVYTPEK